MKSIQEQLMYTTLRIECINNVGSVYAIGTGFLMASPVDEKTEKIYLVSNKHILCEANSIGITFTKKSNENPNVGNSHRYEIKNSQTQIVQHSNPAVDVAVLDFTNLASIIHNIVYFKTVSYDMLASFEEDELNIAENVLFVGYPDNRYDASNNLPLIRTGLISSHPKYDYNGNPVFIIDAQVFPGSSGSPVFIDLTYENMKNGKIVVGERKIKLLGIVAQTMIRKNKLQSINAATSLGTEEILGLGIVYKSTAIKELIDGITKI